MGVFNKLKSIFYDEVVVEDETQDLNQVSKIVKKETDDKDEAPKVEELKFKTVEINPIEEDDEKIIEEEKKEEPKTDVNLFRSERTFNFVDFSDDEVNEKEELTQRKNVVDEQPRVVRSTEPARDDTQKVFRPTPVISPIWGVLDKDYKKDEIKEKNVTNESFTSSITDYDNVRRKAYGTLEDELEDTLNTDNKVTTDEIKEELKKEDVDVIESRTTKIEDLIDKIDEATDELDKSMSIEEAENTLEFESLKEENEKEVSDKTLTDSTLEHDLFNLIDSMYDKEE